MVNPPGTYRGLTEAEAANATPASLGDQKWWEVFQDQQLQQLIRTALQQNYDVRIAATRVLEAQAQLGITRANQYPSVYANLQRHQSAQSGDWTDSFLRIQLWPRAASGSWDRISGECIAAPPKRRGPICWPADWARQEVNATLVSNVATAYFQLRELDLELDISKRALASRKESLELTKTLEEHGINSILDVRQAEQLVYTAAGEIADLERRIAQQENLLSILMGNNPAADPARHGPDRAAARPASPHRASVRAARTPPGHPPGRAA